MKTFPLLISPYSDLFAWLDSSFSREPSQSLLRRLRLPARLHSPPAPQAISLSYPYNGTAIPDVTIGNLNKVGVTSSSVSGGFGGRGWGIGATDTLDTFSGTIDLGKYIEFTITATPGTFINLTSLDFGVSRQATGPRQFEWRSSADGFAAPISGIFRCQLIFSPTTTS